MAVVKSSKDNRYLAAHLTTHDGLSRPCLTVPALANLPTQHAEAYQRSDAVAIDEAQFFGDLVDFALTAAERDGKQVVLAGLDGDFRRQPFGQAGWACVAFGLEMWAIQPLTCYDLTACDPASRRCCCRSLMMTSACLTCSLCAVVWAPDHTEAWPVLCKPTKACCRWASYARSMTATVLPQVVALPETACTLSYWLEMQLPFRHVFA